MNLKETLLQEGFAKIHYPASVKRATDNLVKAWIAFCQQSQNHKSLIPFEKNGGYENKDQTIDPSFRDHKEDFHLTRHYDFPSSFNPSPADITLLATGMQLFQEIRPCLTQVAEMLSDATGIDFVKLAVENEDGWILRLLHYPPQQNEMLAVYHPDKGGHTFHLHDSTPGFERFWNNEWQSMSFTEEEMVFFPSMLAQYYSKCFLKALGHRVTSSMQSRTKGRYSIVLFNDYPTGEVRYDKETWGPTQERFLPGENYDMGFDEFKKFFIARVLQDAR